MLCGSNGDRRISGDLENEGIDNVSLALLAQAGGGRAFVRDDTRGLAEVFRSAVVQKYRWYQASYRVDSVWHRRGFDVRLERTGAIKAGSGLAMRPSAWLDAPSHGGDLVGAATPVRTGTALLMPLLGLLLALGFLGPAWFNARRAVFRRVRRKE